MRAAQHQIWLVKDVRAQVPVGLNNFLELIVKSALNHRQSFPAIATVCVALSSPLFAIATPLYGGPTDIELLAAAAANRDLDPRFNGSVREADAVASPSKDAEVSAPFSIHSIPNDTQ